MRVPVLSGSGNICNGGLGPKPPLGSRSRAPGRARGTNLKILLENLHAFYCNCNCVIMTLPILSPVDVHSSVGSTAWFVTVEPCRPSTHQINFSVDVKQQYGRFVNFLYVRFVGGLIFHQGFFFSRPLISELAEQN